MKYLWKATQGLITGASCCVVYDLYGTRWAIMFMGFLIGCLSVQTTASEK